MTTPSADVAGKASSDGRGGRGGGPGRAGRAGDKPPQPAPVGCWERDVEAAWCILGGGEDHNNQLASYGQCPSSAGIVRAGGDVRSIVNSVG